ncbi:ATP synthase F1 subunit epsilon [Bacteriovorax stolpii]|uniref:ATP synthase epsilon chain n=1 Tax=Bacteriovorax stolpii TaxID=960 RepID=A0A2K9NYT7_BACTC|nr:ATP synthase F1 subunit epsilon [Bacteriovorax stolpii]AUO00126.1 ATP synthase F1 subunit epsilon [Bacteriovorax stolpii]QDK39883.1 ATP synthase F1 subunit epsilon [Bacteriovorax stolpii]TDP53983.1 ATP synthase F1 subcomplex epsilon subunit [Bacteriovorax stolpii]
MKYYTVDILTPSKIIAKSIPAESLLIPTVRGQINVLENHTHIVTKLSTGVLTVFGGPDYADRNFLVSNGVCKILENKITVLANTAEESTDVNVERAKLSLQNAEEKLKNTEGLSLEEIDEYVQKAERAKLRIQLAEFTRPR